MAKADIGAQPGLNILLCCNFVFLLIRGCLSNFLVSNYFATSSTVVLMDEALLEPPLTSYYYRYRPPRQRMPYYGYYSKPLGPPLSPFVKKRLPKYGSQYIPLYWPRYLPPKNIPVYEKGRYVPPYGPVGGTGYQPRRVNPCPEPHVPKNPKRNLTRNPTQPYADVYQRPLSQNPYNGMLKGRRDTITKGSGPYVARAPLPRMTKGPVLYSPKDLEPHIPKVPLPRMSKGPVLYSPKDLEPHLPKVPPLHMTKGPARYPTKLSPPIEADDSQLSNTKGPQLHMPKGTTKGPRLVVTKVPRFRMLNFSRSFRKRGSRRNLVKGSQPSLTKDSQHSLAKGSRVSLAKGSQPNLDYGDTSPTLKKNSKNVKVSRTGKKYCSTAKWPF